MTATATAKVDPAARTHSPSYGLDTGATEFDVTPIRIAADGSGEVADLRLSASSPARFFAIPLPEDALVCVTLKELSSTSRCALLLSPTEPRPSRETAAWQLASPEPMQTLVVHPADGSYRRGTLYLAVRYLELSGSSFASLRVRVCRTFYSIDYRREVRRGGPADHARAGDQQPQGQEEVAAASFLSSGSVPMQLVSVRPLSGTSFAASVSQVGRGGDSAMTAASVCSSLYIGAWRGRHHHGRGVCFYASTPDPHGARSSCGTSAAAAGAPTTPALLLQTVYERRSLPWSALSLPENPTLDGTSLDAAFIAKITGLLDTRSAAPTAGAEHPCGAAGPPSSSTTATERWRLVQAPIYQEGIEVYDGDWVDGRKEGHGVYQWQDRAYVGEWQGGQRHGHGELHVRDGSYYRGSWRHDRRDGHGEALIMPEGTVYTGEWRADVRAGHGSLRYPSGVLVHGTWAADDLAPGCEVRAEYPDGTVYVGEWASGCRHGRGRSTDARGRVHAHTWVEDRRHGPGEVHLPSGVRFDGVWHEDVLVDGVYRFPNGDAYRGGWDADRGERAGHGTCTSRNGDVYEGAWAAGRRHGHGTMHYAGTGAVYDGAWADDEPSGEGRLEDADGVYVGGFLRGERSGEGEQVGQDGASVYRGGWLRGHRAGRGTQYDAKTGITYTGVFLHDRLQGEGRATSSDCLYDGTWLDGAQQGHGTLRLPSGDVVRGVWHRGRQQDGRVELEGQGGDHYVGDWRDGVRCGVGAQVYASDGSVYEGEWRDDKPHGHGRLTRANGESVECEWLNGDMADGEGIVTFTDGGVYEGEVCQSKPHGTGTLTYPDGTVFRGSFVEGVYVL